ncbi:hypothetical protein DXG03_002836 [Asterophora parasitica]|uniref:Lipoyl-binding domain-containing protein n=1 Tax=Asterophora parasitica TaxID=117018 RepID=A0A9P7KAS6_9AGAR|nr:hypothetical protein DXG03_002836 [Asterophora parasitica]
MPAMSPFMTVGTITNWRKKEGEAFARGEVLLQIESDIATIDVEAETAGILGKILVPDGSTDIPVEQVIALVVNNDRQLAPPSLHVPGTPPPYNPTPIPPSRSLASPVHATFNQPFLSPTLRSPRLGEISPGFQHHRGMATQHARAPKLAIVPPSPRITVSLPIKSTSKTMNMDMSTSSSQARERPAAPLDGPVCAILIPAKLD